MATLANVQGSSLVPDLTNPLAILRQGFGTPQTREAQELQLQNERRRQQAIQDALGSLTPGIAGPVEGADQGIVATPAQEARADKAIERLATLDPAAATAVQRVRQSRNKQERQEFLQETQNQLRQAKLIQGEPNFAAKQRAIKSLAVAKAGRGEPTDKILKLMNITTEEELDLELRRMEVMGQEVKAALPGRVRFSKGQSFITEDAAGNQVLATPVLDQSGGTMRIDTQPLTGALLSKLGETAAGESERKVRQAEETASAKQRVKLATDPEIATATGTAKAEVTRDTKLFQRGMTAADAIPDLKRGVELLDLVKTGGFARASLAAKQFFGIESADEAELSTTLGKAVLGQLRDIFGAAFTAQEGAQLKAIEAGFGKSVAGNRRLLQRALRLTERIANRAVKRAESVGNTRMAEELREAMSFSLSPEGVTAAPAAAGASPATTQQPAAALPTATNPQTGEVMVFRDGQWQPQ